MNRECLEIYLSSYYFTVITMATIGYGDIRPTNSQEKIFIIILALFSCGK